MSIRAGFVGLGYIGKLMALQLPKAGLETTVFDIYRGAGIETGRKSVAIGLNLQDVSRTLTDDETDAIVARVVADLERECSATIRDR